MDERAQIAEVAQRTIDDFLIPWLRIPSISADSGKAKELRDACSMLEVELESSGFNVKRYELSGSNPVVYAERIVDPTLPTILIYGHYDVSGAALNEKDWVIHGRQLRPFEPTKIRDRLYGRGTTDDKGQLTAHLAAVRYLDDIRAMPCNIKFVVEGNEEYEGETPFAAFVEQNKDLLECDVVLISDTETLQEGYPALSISLKGMMLSKLSADTPKELVAILDASHDPVNNKVLIPHFYDGVVSQPMDSGILAVFGQPEERFGKVIRPENGYSMLEHMCTRPTNSPLFVQYANPNPDNNAKGKTLRITAYGPKTELHSGQFGGPLMDPALNLAHLLAGLRKQGIKYSIDFFDYGTRIQTNSVKPSGMVQITLENAEDENRVFPGIDSALSQINLPRDLFDVEDVAAECRRSYLSLPNVTSESSVPSAYLSFRLVPGQDPNTVYSQFENLVRGIAPNAIFLSAHRVAPFNADTEGSYSKAVEKALMHGYQTSFVDYVRVGGSIPITITFSKLLGVPVILPGLSPPDGKLHEPNESINIDRGIIAGAQSFVDAYRRFAKLEKRVR